MFASPQRSIPTPQPDTRLPFKGSLAFNRNTQEYIPFRTETDAMLASLTLAYRLASPILAVVLALVRHPGFNPADITLSKPEDVWARVAEHTAASQPPTRRCFPFVFPRFILDEVVDILQEERKTDIHVQRDTDGPQMGRVDFKKTDRDLRSLSLVCKEWTQPAQRALGRILAIQDIHKEHVRNALQSPLFGTWTRETVIFRHIRGLNERKRYQLLADSDEVWELMAQLLARTPNVRTLSLCTDGFEMPLRHIADSFAKMPSLQELRICQAGDITQLLGVVCSQLKDLPTLRHLYIQYSGLGSAYTNFVPPSDLEIDAPRPSLEKLTLKIGSASELSLRYITWLTRPRVGEDAYRLKSLSLDLSGCYFSERGCFDALVPCFRSLSTLHVNVSGLSEGFMTRILRECVVLKTLTVFIRHTFENSMFDGLPGTLEELSIDFSSDKPEWERWDDRVTYFIRERATRSLRRLGVHPACYPALKGVEERYQRARIAAAERGIEVDFSCGVLNVSRS